jgi:hypothetical protein
MKKLVILIICIILTGVINGYGQNKGLLLKNKSTGKEKLIHEGERIKVLCKNGLVIRGRLKMNDTSKLVENTVVMIDSQKVNINEIETIKIKSLAGKIITGSGGVLTVGGTALVIVAVFSFGEGGIILAGIGLTGIGAGVAITIAGVIILVSGKKYTSELWVYSIIAR